MGLRTGRHYLSSLQDGRQVYLDGQLVRDVTRDPRLGLTAQTVADLYDMQHDPRWRDVLTAPGPDGERVPVACLQPRDAADLARRRAAMKCWADATCGLFGRTPDFMNLGIATLAAASAVFDKSASGRSFAANVRAFHERVCREDLTMTHIQVNPAVDRSKQVHQQARDIALKIVRESDAGFWVHGMRLVGTLAQFADEIVVMPSVVVSNDDNAGDYAFAFVTPVAAPGIRVISRPTVVPQNPGHFLDHPLSIQYDEGDAVIVFDDVFVPWERTFIFRDPAMCNAVYRQTYLAEHYSHQTMTRALAKAEFMAGLACKLAAATKVDGFPNVQAQLAELLIVVETQRALLLQSEQQCSATGFGTVAPSKLALHAAQLNFHEKYSRMIDVLRAIGAGSLIGVPSYAELQGDIGHVVREYMATATLEADERIRLTRLAADASISAFSGRQALYERYYQGDPVRKVCGYYLEYPKQDLTGRIDALLQDLDRKAARLAG
ncbi:MAG TPA: 4-hydroxyphenylacetate 3-hydroxylase N-terminal domain-containing protein [Ramlibacter sp.]|nr:4-hydroxyphenylacetate 3-hydroxylase N-terminal domain-containing protein [Ramlibacter sp.]